MRIGLTTTGVTGVIDMIDVGRPAVTELLHLGHEIGMVPDIGEIDFIDEAHPFEITAAFLID